MGFFDLSKVNEMVLSCQCNISLFLKKISGENKLFKPFYLSLNTNFLLSSIYCRSAPRHVQRRLIKPHVSYAKSPRTPLGGQDFFSEKDIIFKKRK